VLEERVLLEVISLLEADRADGADERSLVGVCASMVLVRRVLREPLPTDVACPLAQARWRRRRRRVGQRTTSFCVSTEFAPHHTQGEVTSQYLWPRTTAILWV